MKNRDEGSFMTVQTIKSGEGKCSVFRERTTDSQSRLRSCVSGTFRVRVELVSGLYATVAKKTEHISMDIVRAGASDYVDGATEAAAEFRSEAVAIDLKLCNGLLGDRRTYAAGIEIVLHAVDGKRVSSAVAAAKTQS